MKWFLILLAAISLSLGSSCTYTRSARGLECSMQHSWKGHELCVEVHGKNTGHRPITVILNPNFHHLSLDAKDEKRRSNLQMSSISWSHASPESLKTLRHGDSILWTRGCWTIKSIGKRHWRIRDTMGDGFDTTDPALRASFGVGWHPDYLPWKARHGKLNIFKGDREGEFGESIEISLDEKRRDPVRW